MPRLHSIRLLVPAVLLAAGCSSDTGQSRSSNFSSAGVGLYDPTDALTVRLHDLVVLPGADLQGLTREELKVVNGPFQDDQGRTMVSLYSTGAMASLLEKYGLLAEGHRLGPAESRLPMAPDSCGPWPVNSQLFAWYDFDPGAYNGGVQAELLSYNDPAHHIRVQSLGPSVEGREVLAVRIGRSQTSDFGTVPAVYVVATHHAREWVTEEVALRLVRFYVDSMRGTGGDPSLPELLADREVVFVPVENPDGYQYSRSTFREQRRNRRNTGCGGLQNGVDLNRNYAVGWGAPADSVDGNPCSDVYRGSGAASEPETQAMQWLLSGTAFLDPFTGSGRQAPAASLSYHSYSDDLIYPGGYKPAPDASGPRCLPSNNCFNPDFPVYRRLYGDTESPLVFDTTVAPAQAYPADMENNISYTTSGDMTLHANYTAGGHVSTTIELTGSPIGFYIECQPGADAIVQSLVDQQAVLIKGLIQNAAALVSSSAGTAYAPTQFGQFAAGFWVREASSGLTQDTARPRFLKSLWPASTNASLVASLDGTVYNYNPARRASQYRGYSVDLTVTGHPLCIPCRVDSIDITGQHEGGDTTDCTTCIDLCDVNRLSHDSGWNLIDGFRGGSRDCWWEPTPSSTGDQSVYVWGGSPPASATHCHLMFTTLWNGDLGGGPVILERFDGANWNEVTRWPLDESLFFETRRGFIQNPPRLRSTAVEINNSIPSGALDSFRFRIPAGASQPDFKLFDPVIYCRLAGP